MYLVSMTFSTASLELLNINLLYSSKKIKKYFIITGVLLLYFFFFTFVLYKEIARNIKYYRGTL